MPVFVASETSAGALAVIAGSKRTSLWRFHHSVVPTRLPGSPHIEHNPGEPTPYRAAVARTWPTGLGGKASRASLYVAGLSWSRRTRARVRVRCQNTHASRPWPISSAGADGGTKITGHRGASAPADQRQPRDCLPSAPPQRLPNAVLTLNSQIWAIPRLLGTGVDNRTELRILPGGRAAGTGHGRLRIWDGEMVAGPAPSGCPGSGASVARGDGLAEALESSWMKWMPGTVSSA